MQNEIISGTKGPTEQHLLSQSHRPTKHHNDLNSISVGLIHKWEKQQFYFNKIHIHSTGVGEVSLIVEQLEISS
jgi:hypothetical protein